MSSDGQLGGFSPPLASTKVLTLWALPNCSGYNPRLGAVRTESLADLLHSYGRHYLLASESA